MPKLVQLVFQCHICEDDFLEAAKLRNHLVNVEFLCLSKPVISRRVNNDQFTFVKVLKNKNHEDLFVHRACVCCKDHFEDIEDLRSHFECHIFPSRKRSHDEVDDGSPSPLDSQSVTLAHGKRCYNFNTLSSVAQSFDSPKFKHDDITRLKPAVIMAIKSNFSDLPVDIQDRINYDDECQRSLKSLSTHQLALSTIRDCISLNDYKDIPVELWSIKLPETASTREQQFFNLVQYILTTYASRCARMVSVVTNHERSYFIDYVIPIFQIFHDQLKLLRFQWCEVYIQGRNTGIIDIKTWNKERICYADGIGYDAETEKLLMEASSGPLDEDIEHTLGDSLKQLENLSAILNTNRLKYANARLDTFTNLKILGIQTVKNTITLCSVSLSKDGKYLYQEHRSGNIPVTHEQRYQWLPVFELLAFLMDTCIEQNQVLAELGKEQSGFYEVAREDTVKELKTPETD